MSRCISEVLGDGAADGPAQAAAICASKWEDARKMERAYSVLTIKSMEEDKRELVGIATTPGADREGDVIEPKGASFALPIPLLWQHDSRQPIGHVTHARVTDGGIEVRAKLASVAEPGRLRDRLDEAWQSIKAGLVRGLSIGFRPLERSRLDTGAARYLKWEWLELSAVTVPANADCNILAIKAAYGRTAPGARPVIRLDPASPGDSGQPPARKSGVIYL